MGDTGKRVDFEKLFSLANDLIGMLNDGKDGDNLMQSLENGKSLRSFCETNAHEINSSLEECQERIKGCRERIEKVKGEVIADSILNVLHTELEEKMEMEHSLRQELRVVDDELGGLDQQRISFEERWKLVKKRENDTQKLRDSLSMCASVTGIIPDHTNKKKISGFFVERSKKKAEKFEFDPATPPFEVCDRLWEMSSQQDSLSMCASVTGIIPDHTNKKKISGFIVERSKKKAEKFEFDPATPPFEVCDRLWEMSSQQ